MAGDADNWPPLETEDIEVDPKTLRPQAVNARFMTAAQMDQLVENVRRDGKLTSVPLGYQPDASAPMEVISGHHRIEAACRIGLATITVRVVRSRLSEQRKTALQLSHNAITGQDDPTTLAAMYAGLDLSAKSYSGLDDSVLDALKDVNLAGLSVGLKYQEMKFFFLSEDAEVVAAVIKDIDAAAKKGLAHVAAYKDFDAFFDVIVRIKTKFEAFNSAVAMRLLIDLASERLDQLEPKADGQ